MFSLPPEQRTRTQEQKGRSKRLPIQLPPSRSGLSTQSRGIPLEHIYFAECKDAIASGKRFGRNQGFLLVLIATL
jgi:hypothetical protein